MNDIERAIETLKDMKSYFNDRSHRQYSMPAIDTAISALEKQRLRKPAETFTDGAFKRPYNICPTCKTYVNRINHLRNCGNCGQGLDWRVEE